MKNVVFVLLSMCCVIASCSDDARFPIVDDNGRIGFINREGDVVIVPQFDGVTDFSEGLCAVIIGEKRGFIDADGRMVINPVYDRAKKFSEGFSAVKIDDKWGYIDKKGKFVINPTFSEVFSFSEGLAQVRTDSGRVYIDKKGQHVVSCLGSRIVDEFSEGLTPIDYCGQYMDRNGNIAISLEGCPGVGFDFSEGLAVISEKGVINKKGEWVVKDAFSWSDYEYREGLLAIQKEDKWGYMDKDGVVVIPCQFEYASGFSEGIAAVKVAEGKWGVIDKSGKFVINPIYERVSECKNGLMSVVLEKGEEYGDQYIIMAYLDKEGQEVYKRMKVKR